MQNEQTGEIQPLPYDSERGGIPVVNRDKEVWENIAVVRLGTSDTAICTFSKEYKYVEVYVANVNGSDVTYQIHRVVPSGSSADANAIFKGGTITMSNPHVFEDVPGKANHMLKGLCSSANGVTVHVDGIPR